MESSNFPSFSSLKHPPDYKIDLEKILDNDYTRMKGSTYVDFAGSALYSQKLLDDSFSLLSKSILGNPHSRHLPSDIATQGIDAIRERILDYFGTSSSSYDVIFTSGATSAIKLIAENFAWFSSNKPHPSTLNKPSSAFIHVQENHTSVLGLREAAFSAGAHVHSIPSSKLVDFFNQYDSENVLVNDSPGEQENDTYGNCIFALSGLCNFSGAKYPLSWIQKAQDGNMIPLLDNLSDSGSFNGHTKWYVLLDAASLVATCPLDLSVYKPDFVPISFYKIFGYPTGLGCLLVSKRASNVLRKKYFGGGTVEFIDSSSLNFSYRKELCQRFEDGTLPFLSILTLEFGFKNLTQMTGGMKTVEKYVFHVARYFHHNLKSMIHANGQPLAVIYEHSYRWSLETHGGIVNFNLLAANGSYIGYTQVEKVASLYNIYLRTGCLCNPGACQLFLGITPEKLSKHFEAGHVCGDTLDVINNEPTGSIRVSFGPISTYSDADRVLQMIRECFAVEPLAICTNWLIAGESFEESSHTKLHTKFKSILPVNNVSCPLDNILTDIIIYPVKSCAGYSATSWHLDECGLEYDRHWMIVTSSGITITMKRAPKMALIKPFINLRKKILQLSCEGYSACEVALNLENNPVVEANLCGGKICGDRIEGLDCGDEVGAWVSAVLGMEGLKLMQKNRNAKRHSKLFSSGKENLAMLSLANEAQFLALHRPSVRELLRQIDMNGRETLNEDELVLRFRPNLVFDGGAAYEDEKWKKISIGECPFEVHSPCVRCQMICVSPKTGERTREPLLSLASSRGSLMKFGMYLSQKKAPSQNKKLISVHMPISIDF